AIPCVPKRTTVEDPMTANPQDFPLALTFDDALLVPHYSEVLPANTQVASQLAPDFPLHVPLVSAAMDTVTESATAIAMAREGGLGFIHKSLSIEQQALAVTKVKKSESGMIVDPVAIRPDKTVADALAMMR